MNEPSRRGLLAALASTAVGAATSGCLGGSAPDGQNGTPGTDSGSTTVDGTDRRPSSGTPDGLFHWLPAPSAVDEEPFVVDWGDLDAIRSLDRGDELPGPSYSGAVDLLVTRDRPAIVPPENLTTTLRITGGDGESALSGTVLSRLAVDEAQVEGRFMLAGYDRVDTDREATLLRSGTVRDGTETVGILDGVLVRSFDPSGQRLVETVLDAASGQAPRLVDEQPDVATVVAETSGANYRILGTDPQSALPEPDDPLSDATAVTYAWTLAPSESTFELVATYPEADQPGSDAFTEFVRTDVTSDSYQDLSTVIDARVVTTTGELDTESFRLFLRAAFASDSDGDGSNGTGSGDEEEGDEKTTDRETENEDTTDQAAPEARFAFEYEPSTETLTVRHDGGDSVDADRLYITADRVAIGTQFSDDVETVSTGSSVTVDVSDLSNGTTVAVIWDGPAEGDVEILGRFTLP